MGDFSRLPTGHVARRVRRDDAARVLSSVSSPWTSAPLRERQAAMEKFQIVISPDVVDVLRHEHEQIRQLCIDVRKAGPGRRRQELAALGQTFYRHQLGERAVAHPAVRNSGADGNAIALGIQLKSEQLDRSLTEILRLGVEHADFDATFATLSDGLLAHAADQESDEFPLLRRHVSAQRLHMMAGAMNDIRIMALD
ncbi:hemerythrin domain-containing protein [Actinoplanes sp. HUAS TT8]|uniref:hemerythrin domain-containing protein n=1 Tax=Actinoplanes sp. HUAS TT8 TaxID=3447453 RepID=UPI003F52660F